MKYCPKCKLNVGGEDEFCPLCQGELVGTPTEAAYPRVEPPKRRLSMMYKVVAFVLLAATVVCITVDLLTPGPHWSLPVALCVAAFLVMLRIAMNQRPNVPRLLFQLLLAVSAVAIICDWYLGSGGFSLDYVVPTLCTVTLIVNFGLAFVRKRFAENGLVYLLMNILIGVLPYLLLFLRADVRPVAWVVCLVVSVITFLGLAVFKGRELFVEMHKRLHL
ncbi:MAG: DUF6320 domain-containing protein [Gemmiger sp.]